MAEISQNANIEMLEKLPDGTYKRIYLKTTKEQVGLDEVDNIKQMPIAGSTFTGISKAHPNTSYTVAQLRNVILSTSDAVVGSMSDGDIWIKYR